MIVLEITEPGPLTSVQDDGRFKALKHGVAASGPMDRSAFVQGRNLLGCSSETALEIAAGRTAFVVRGGAVRMACSGGAFNLHVNARQHPWGQAIALNTDDRVEITPGAAGNYAYVRFDREIDVPRLMGSRATNTIARLGGLEGRALVRGDLLKLVPLTGTTKTPCQKGGARDDRPGPIRFIWGVHSGHFSPALRRNFISETFVVSQRLDRMGVRLRDPTGVFASRPNLSLVSDAVVPGDIQILGDGTPIVLMRDHQPTGGYPRIGTLISADLDRFAQLRPGSEVRFSPVTVDHAHSICRQAHKNDLD
ncbi:MAG TPA: biotin-dependent carboxyltransferase [Devosia sp.]|nr:biotin-dependent carboxyltransferase [Devosia sp.]